MTDELTRALKSTFGYDAFRPLQREIIETSLAGRDVLAILPTGAGKSICYQLPALLREGLTLVVSPLIALMKDQVDALVAAGVEATFLNSSIPSDEAARRRAGLDAGRYRLLYAAPERIMTAGFSAELRRWGVSAVAIDEAHCISEWGHDFRPEYRQLGALRRALHDVPFIAMTATATPEVKGDIAHQLGLIAPAVFQASFNRPNLRYAVSPKKGGASQVDQILELVNARPEAAGIVYCRSRQRTEDVAQALIGAGVKALAYHAGLDSETRSKNQEAFIRDEVRVVCATVAFGMGIDKPDVRFVVHADLPKHLEGYYQETGRAGRDGLPSECVLLFAPGDIAQNLHFLDELPEDAAAIARRQLQAMADYAESHACRRKELLAWFGEDWPHETCGACDNCDTPRERFDATLLAQKLLSCIIRVHQHSRRTFGLRHIVDVLRGSKNQKLIDLGHGNLTTYGIGADTPAEIWMSVGRQLIRSGHIATSDDRWQTMSVSALGREALSTRANFTLTRPMVREPQEIERASKKDDSLACDEGLFQALRVLRKAEADARGLAPYMVFGDQALRHMARSYPLDDTSFLAVPGVGRQKLADYGAAFTTTIRTWLDTNPRLDFGPPPAPKPERPASTELSATALESAKLFEALRDLDQVATARGLKVTTITQHLVMAIEASRLDANPRDFYSAEAELELRRAAAEHGLAALGPLHASLGARYPYETLHLFRAFERRGAT
ncbi:MAG TPA: DNA helicase RecQ [Myxococcota bacterium]|nr:DNA helicase RecQ [Myxococcota bacterium]